MPSGVSHASSSAAVPVASSTAVGPLRRRVGGAGRLAQLDVGEVGDAAAHAAHSQVASRVRSSTSTASQPAKTNASTPACRYAASRSPGGPARPDPVAPGRLQRRPRPRRPARRTAVSLRAQARDAWRRWRANASATACGEPRPPCVDLDAAGLEQVARRSAARAVCAAQRPEGGQEHARRAAGGRRERRRGRAAPRRPRRSRQPRAARRRRRRGRRGRALRRLLGEVRGTR